MIKDVTVIIPSFNRFSNLQHAIKSVIEQINSELRIIIINDGSTQKAYYEYTFPNNITKIDLEINQRKSNNFSADSIRNFGLKKADTKYVAFLDDDDYWMPNKIITQINAMKKNDSKFSSTDGYIGAGLYNNSKKYEKYNQEFYYQSISEKFKYSSFYPKRKIKKQSFEILENITLDFLLIHNVIITSSVIVETDLINSIGMFDPRLPNGVGDYDCWKKILTKTTNLYVNDALVYYDNNHGDGRNYEK